MRRDLTVLATDAVRAARWGAERTPGLYAMMKMLGM
jgi:dihydrodipicolinate reductase